MPLDVLPDVNSFFGLDLKTGSFIVAALGIVHPLAFGCTCFVHISYIFITIWLLVAVFFMMSIGLFYGLAKNDATLCSVWVWYTMIFHCMMIVMLLLLIILFATKKQRHRILAILFAIVWYILTVYFILVVNSHRKQLNIQQEQALHLSSQNIVLDYTYRRITPDTYIL